MSRGGRTRTARGLHGAQREVVEQTRDIECNARVGEWEEEDDDEDDEDEDEKREVVSDSQTLVKKTDHEESEQSNTNSTTLTDPKNLTSKDKARLKRQQLQDETILKLLSKSKDKNAIALRALKRKKPYTPYTAKGEPMARYVSVNGESFLLVPEDVTLFPTKPPHVKKRDRVN